VYLFLDARYEKVRRNGSVQDATVLIAVGVDNSGYRQVLGVSVSLSEHEVHWRDFLLSLAERGLAGVQLVISDDHAGLKAVRTMRAVRFISALLMPAGSRTCVMRSRKKASALPDCKTPTGL
jgi:transposase-like protein